MHVVVTIISYHPNIRVSNCGLYKLRNTYCIISITLFEKPTDSFPRALIIVRVLIFTRNDLFVVFFRRARNSILQYYFIEEKSEDKQHLIIVYYSTDIA